MKKVLSLVLAIAMILSSMSFAFADTYSDVTEDTKTLLTAVEVLSRFKVINGLPDGRFDPQGSLTRAAMAKMLVIALGHEDIVDGSKSSFVDAKGTWYDSYAAIAQGLGIVEGFPDGTFKGEEKVTYGQAVTMILRSLGYNNKAVNSDKSTRYNELGYKTTAARIGLLNEVSFKNGSANRGDAAIMIYNALEANLVTVEEDGAVTPKPIVRNGEKEDMILLDCIGEFSLVTVTLDKIYSNDIVDLREYLGETIKTIVIDDQVAYVIGRTQKVTYESVKEIGSSLSANTLKIQFNSYEGNKYEVNEGTNDSSTKPAESTLTAYLNNVELVACANHEKLIDGLTVNAASASDTNKQKTRDEVTTKVKIVTTKDTKKVASYVFETVSKTALADTKYVEGKTRYQGIDFPLNSDKKVNLDRIIVEGDVNSLEDIAVNDVIEAYVGRNKDNAVDNVRLVITRNTDTGKIAKAQYSGSTHKTYVVNDITYKYNPLTDVNVELDELLRDKEEKAVYYLDQNDRIAFTSKPAVARNYALVLDVRKGQISEYSVDNAYEVVVYPKALVVNSEGKKEWINVYFEMDGKTGAVIANSVAEGFTITPNSSTKEIGVAVAPSMDVSRLVDKSDVSASDPVFITEDDHADYVVEIAIEDSFITGIYNTSLHNILKGKKANANFLANEDTLIFERSEGRNSYKLVKYSDLTASNVYYQYVYGWDVAIITLEDKTAPSNVIYGVINDNQHYSGYGHEFTGYFIDRDGALRESFVETVNGEKVATKVWNGSNYVELNANQNICTGAGKGVFDDNYMGTFVRFEKDSKGYISSVATASAIQTNEFKNVSVTMRSNRAYLNYTAAADGTYGETRQLSEKLVVFLSADVSGTGRVEMLEIGIEEFDYYISNELAKNINMSLYNLGSYPDLIDVIFINSLH